MTEPNQTLTDIELDLVFFIERFHSSNGVAPTDAQINMRFTGLTPEIMENFKTNKLVLKSLKARGINYPAPADKFTPEQMHAAAVMTDLIDRRSEEKKLRDMGITTRQWASWQLDDEFAAYLRDRSEKMLANSMHEAHKGLMKGVRNGNVASVKTFYEITNRYRPNEEAQIDVRRVLHTFIEVIQKYVKDPIVLHQIAMELSQVASTESYSTGLANQMTAGAPYVLQGSATVIPSLPRIEDLNDE